MFEPHWEEKVWGRVWHLFANKAAAVSHLKLKEGFRCSLHRHRFRANMFAVLDGIVVVEKYYYSIYREQKAEIRPIILRPGDTLIVPSGVWHQFRVGKSGEMTEVYWPDTGGICSIDDIQRHDQGGPDPNFEDLKRYIEDNSHHGHRGS